MKRLLLLFPLLLFSACTCAGLENTPEKDLVEISGTVTFVPVEGGFFGIVADNGQKYDPMNLPAELQKNGLKIAIKGRIRKDVSSFRMWGEILEIISASPQ